MSKVEKLIFKLNITTEDNNIRKIIIEKNENKFEFKSNDESYNEIEKFIDYLLEHIEEYDQIDFEINENINDINSDLAKEFKNIWINDYKEIKNKLNNFYNNIDDIQSNSKEINSKDNDQQ